MKLDKLRHICSCLFWKTIGKSTLFIGSFVGSGYIIYILPNLRVLLLADRFLRDTHNKIRSQHHVFLEVYF